MTSPELSTFKNLYNTTAPGVRLIVANHTGSILVYSAADNATALPVAQLPNADMFPDILIVSPYEVVALSLNVTAIAVAAAQDALVVVVLVVTALVLVPVDPALDDELEVELEVFGPDAR